MSKQIKWTDRTLPKIIQHVQDKFCNPYIRLRDNELFGKCISSNGNIEHAGHFYSVGSHPGMRFRINNIHGQSIYSNKHKHGDLLNYRKGLIDRHGLDYIERLERDEQLYNHYGSKLDKFDVILIGKTYQYLFKNKIWIFEQKEFDNYKIELSNKLLSGLF